MKEIYCKFCGLELERGACTCEKFLSEKNDTKELEKKTCDTCGKKIDKDSNFCPFCGVIVGTEVYKRELKKEMQGEYAQDVLEDIKRKEKEKIEAIKSEIFTPGTKLAIRILSCVLVLLLIVKIVFVVKDVVTARNEKKYLESMEKAKTENIVETQAKIQATSENEQPIIAIHDNWIRSEGYYYCLNKDGDPVIDDWIEEEDENGNKKYYYFDIDGRLVVNSWIDGEYFVGADGAMYVDRMTPDGAYVDSTGKVIIDEEAVRVPVEKETRIYYESPDENAKVKSSAQKSSSAGNIKGVDETKTYELYIKDIKVMRDSYTEGTNKCNITYYYPIIMGGKEKEVKTINELILDMFNDRFRNVTYGIRDIDGKVPKSIVLNTVEQRQVTSNRFIFLIHGKLIPQKGFSEKKKFRFIYDRKSKKLDMLDISEY